jgi:peptidyl-prolyl cis-trans isomerase D
MLARIAFERPDSLEPAAAELGHEIRTVEGVTRRGGPEIGANPSVIDAAWSEAVFERRENSALIELDDGHAAVIRVVDYNPPELQPLDQVTEEIADELRRNRAAVQARELGREARERLEAGETIDEIAEALAGDYVAGLTIVRNDVSVPPDVSRAAFAAPRPAADAPTVVGTESATGYFVIKVRSVTPGGLDLLRPDERQELIDAIRNGRASRELQAYLEDLRQNARVTIFERSLE